MRFKPRHLSGNARTVFGIDADSAVIHNLTVNDLRGRTRCGKTARHLGTYRNDFDLGMLCQLREQTFAAVIAAVVFAVLAQKAGAYRDFHGTSYAKRAPQA